MVADPQFTALIGAVRSNIDTLVAGVVACFRAEIPAYTPIPDADLVPGVRSNVERALMALERGWQPAEFGGTGRIAVELNTPIVVSAIATSAAADGDYLRHFFSK